MDGLDRVEGRGPTPERELEVLYASETLIAVNKPAGIIVHGDGNGDATLTDEVRALLASSDGVRYPTSPVDELQALQRLDRDTSGIVLFSRRKATQAAYDRLIAEHRVEKCYLAIVAGAFPRQRKVFDGPLGRDRHDARRMRVSPTGKPARTEVRLVEVVRGAKARSLVRVRITTGRKHQIRVHLSHAGFPIVGDALYGRPDRRGLMLHAAHLAFTDPVTGEDVHIDAPMPARFTKLLNH